MATQKKSLIGSSKKAKGPGGKAKTTAVSGKSISAKKMASPDGSVVGGGPGFRLALNHNQTSLKPLIR